MRQRALDGGAGACQAPGMSEPTEGRWATLPEPIRLEDTITTQETIPARDPEMGRDTETEFMLRNAG
jgi:hypothetical protein